MIETERLIIRKIEKEDKDAFIEGISDVSLRRAYGIPVDANEKVSAEIFSNFSRLKKGYSIIKKGSDTMIGFLLDVDLELPIKTASELHGSGNTLAFAVFKPYQRQGYMTETLQAYIPYLFHDDDIGFIHCGHFSDNEPCRRLLQKLGYREFSRHTLNGRLIIDEVLEK